jgi:hypothetical protein
MNPELWLGVSLVAAGLWSGLLLTLTTILHPMFSDGDGASFTRDLDRFLPVARASVTNYVLVALLMVGPAMAVASQWGDGTTAFVLTVVGAALTLIGPFALSRFMAEPNYDVILSWDPDHLPTGWTRIRHRYFALNWIRGGLTWVAFACFVAATFSYLG